MQLCNQAGALQMYLSICPIQFPLRKLKWWSLHSFLGQIISFCGKTLLFWCDFPPPPHMANLTFPFLFMVVCMDAICTLKCHHSPSQSHCCACSSGLHLWGGGNGVLLCWRVGGWRDEKHGNPDYCNELGDQTLFIGFSAEAEVWSSIPWDIHEDISQDDLTLLPSGNALHLLFTFAAVCFSDSG